jgi:hypothetical protein
MKFDPPVNLVGRMDVRRKARYYTRTDADPRAAIRESG